MLYQLVLPGPDEEGVTLDYPTGFKFNTVAGVINEALKYIFPLAGLILFFMLIAAGFLMLTSAGDEEKNKKASTMLTSAVIGFVVLFVSFWLIKLLETIFGLKVL